MLVIGNGTVSEINGELCKDKHFYNFMKEMAQLFPNVDFCEFKKKTSPNENILDCNLLKLPINLELVPYVVREGIVKKIIFYLDVVTTLFRVMKSKKFSYIYFPGSLPVLAASISIIQRKPYGLYLRGEVDFDKLIPKYIIKKAKFILCTGTCLKEMVVKYNKNASEVSPMIELSKHDLYQVKQPLKKIKKLLFVGRIEKNKGVWDLLNAFQKLQVQFPDICLHIVGGGQCFDNLVKFINKNNFAKCIVLHGFVSDKIKLEEIYKSSDLFVQCSYTEGFPRVLYEAMTYAMPILTTTVGSIKSLMKNDYNCKFITPGDVGSIIDAVEELYDDVEKRTFLSNNAIHSMKLIFEENTVTHASQVKEYLLRLGY